MLRRVVAFSIEVEERVEIVRQYVASVADPSLLKDVFGFIERLADLEGLCVIRSENLRRFLEVNGDSYMNDRERASVDLLVSRMNKDKASGKVSLPEWVSALTPVL